MIRHHPTSLVARHNVPAASPRILASLSAPPGRAGSIRWHAGRLLALPKRRRAQRVVAVAITVVVPCCAALYLAETLREVGGPVYTVAALRAQLARQGPAWLGRGVRVRAAIDPCAGALQPSSHHCATFAPALVDGTGGPLAGTLPLQLGQAPRSLEVLRRIPLLNRLLQGPQALRWGAVAVYRVRLVGCALPAKPACYEAVLLDAAPVADNPARHSGGLGSHHSQGLVPSTD